jgi:flavin reductase (DIM6/NTAB) family NADH-FMN oxidoreductase RutF
VNIADETMIEHVHLSAIEYEPEVSEAEALGLAVAPSSAIRTPRLANAPVSLECRLHRIVEFGDTGSEFIVGEILVWRVRDGLLKDGKIDTLKLRPIARIAGPRYAKLGEIVDLAPIRQTEKTVLGEKR